MFPGILYPEKTGTVYPKLLWDHCLCPRDYCASRCCTCPDSAWYWWCWMMLDGSWWSWYVGMSATFSMKKLQRIRLPSNGSPKLPGSLSSSWLRRHKDLLHCVMTSGFMASSFCTSWSGVWLTASLLGDSPQFSERSKIEQIIKKSE